MVRFFARSPVFEKELYPQIILEPGNADSYQVAESKSAIEEDKSKQYQVLGCTTGVSSDLRVEDELEI